MEYTETYFILQTGIYIFSCATEKGTAIHKTNLLKQIS